MNENNIVYSLLDVKQKRNISVHNEASSMDTTDIPKTNLNFTIKSARSPEQRAYNEGRGHSRIQASVNRRTKYIGLVRREDQIHWY